MFLRLQFDRSNFYVCAVSERFQRLLLDSIKLLPFFSFLNQTLQKQKEFLKSSTKALKALGLKNMFEEL